VLHGLFQGFVVGRRDNGGMSIAVILLIVLVGLVLGDMALVRALSRRGRGREPDDPSG
jgi:hypothetical protein